MAYRCCIALLTVLVACLAASSSERAFYSNENRSVFVLPRNAALANADICFSRDAISHTNPATLPLDSSSRLVLSYAGYYDNAYNTSTVSYVTRILDDAGAGISLGYLYVPDIVYTDNLEVNAAGEPVWDPALLDYVSASDLLLNVVFGQRFIPRPDLEIGLGARLHALRRRLPDETGYGIGLDAGAVLSLPRKGIRFSLLVNDLTTNYIYWDSRYNDLSLPSVQLGAGWDKDIPYFYGRFVVAYRTPDVLSDERLWFLWGAEEQGVRFVDEGDAGDVALSFLFLGHYGLEYVIRDVVALRGGFSSGRVCFGGGINLFSQALFIDFSYVASELDGTYHVSAGYRW